MTLAVSVRFGLDDHDRRIARKCAKDMIKDAQERSARDRFDLPSDKSHYLGALGEIAFARFRGVPWRCHPASWSRPDVDGYEVRAHHAHNVYVKAKPKDKAATRIAAVLVASDDTWAEIIGWIEAGYLKMIGSYEAKHGGFPAPAWFLYDYSRLTKFRVATKGPTE